MKKAIPILVVLLCMGSGSDINMPIREGGVARFDATAILMDFEAGNAGNLAQRGAGDGQENGGVTHVGATSTTSGHYSFDGTDDYIVVSDHPSFDMDSGVTLAAWFVNDGSVQVNGEYVFDTAQVGNNSRMAVRINLAGTVLVYFKDTGAQETYRTTNGAYDDGEWHHIVAVADINGGSLTIYVDGVVDQGALTGNFNGGTSIFRPTQGIRIGDIYTGGAGYNWDGLIDEPIVYQNCALSQSEVVELCAQGIMRHP
jgi:hypothetical protein